MMQKLNLTNLRENIFFFCLILFVILLPFSEASVSITSGLLLFQTIILASWKHPSFPHGSWKILLLIISIFFIYVLGTTYTQDLPFAIYEWRKVIFWIILPAAFFFSPALSRHKFILVLTFFCFSVFVASLTGMVKLVFSEYFHIVDFRKIILISHIRFSFQIILSMIILTWFLISKVKIPLIGFKPLFLILLMIWFLYFLILLKSITGIVAFVGTFLVFIVFLIVRVNSLKMKTLLFVSIILLLLVPLIFIGHVWYDFYHADNIDPHTVEKNTPSGNPYTFDFTSEEKENGHWVNIYVCETEMREEWNKISSCKYDSIDKNGYPYGTTLLRYLTSKGFRKDSAGVSHLSPKDIRAIENGLANHIFVDYTFSLYPRIYQTIWELDVYFRSGDPNFQSVSQRIEFVKASLYLIKENPWLGIGTGNWKIRYGEAYIKMNSKLNPENQGPSHNQYMNYLVKFGIVGFTFILCAILIPIFGEGHRKNLFFWLFMILIGITNFGDANLETHMGLSFFSFFYCLFLWHSPEDLQNFKFSSIHFRNGLTG